MELNTLTIDPPSYFSFTGNYAISDNGSLSVIIWPKPFMIGAPKYGVSIYDNNNGIIYRFYVDKCYKYAYIPENTYTNEEIKCINSIMVGYKQTIKNMDSIIHKEWNP